MSAAERATRERLAQGLPQHVEDEHLLDQVAEDLSGDQHDGAGTGPARRRRDRSELTQATRQATRSPEGAG